MDTATMGTQVGDGWERREPPPLFRFEKKGDRLEGILLQRTMVTIQGKPTVKYLVRRMDDSECVFLGTVDITSKLRVTDIGHAFRITYVGEDTMVKRGDNYMRVFEVDVKSAPSIRIAPETNPEITDDDIPF